MRKILSGMLGLTMTAAMVSGVAYAAFSSSASVEGTSFSSGTAALHVWDTTQYTTSWTANWSFGGLYPSFVATPTDFWLRNDSTVAINLAVKGQLRDGVAGDWNALKDKVLVAISDFGETPDPADYHTLADWNLASRDFASAAEKILVPGVQYHYAFNVKVDSAAGNEIQGKILSGVNFDFTGTQNP